jgi:ABC-type transporter Mla MlaB component
MLKIVGHEEREATTLRLQGDVIGLWVEELRRSCDLAQAAGQAVTVDLTDVGFVDRDGVALLHRLEASGVALENASRFVAEQLKAGIR